MRQTYDVSEIKSELLKRLDSVIDRYAPRTNGSYKDRGRYYTLNPWRADDSVGSFYIYTRNHPKEGQWRDHATGEYGDVIDLIRHATRTDERGAFREARAFLGWDTFDPEVQRRAKEQAQRNKERARELARRDREKAERRRKAAHALWLSGQEQIAGTPVEDYLKYARRIDLASLGRQPRALRFHPACRYQHMDKATGEVIEAELPAMVAIVINGKGDPIACHRTYLARDPMGRWRKADAVGVIPAGTAKKVLGNYAGGFIPLWSGKGPRGGKGVSIVKAPPGTHVFAAEGIEDGLSGAVLLPDRRFVAAISLSNLANIDLPKTVDSLTLIGDQDEGEQARAQFDRAARAHVERGRAVRIWRNSHGGKDLNEAYSSAPSDDGGDE
jgi:hypothetical protein